MSDDGTNNKYWNWIIHEPEDELISTKLGQVQPRWQNMRFKSSWVSSWIDMDFIKPCQKIVEYNLYLQI